MQSSLSYISQMVISRSNASATAKNGTGASGEMSCFEALSVGMSLL